MKYKVLGIKKSQGVYNNAAWTSYLLYCQVIEGTDQSVSGIQIEQIKLKSKQVEKLIPSKNVYDLMNKYITKIYYDQYRNIDYLEISEK